MKIALALIGLTVGLASPAFADCKQDVDKAFEKLRNGKTFRQETKIIDDAKGTLSMKVDYILPDKMSQSVSMGNSAMMMETIVTEGKVYSNNGQGWAEVPEKFATAIVEQLKAVAEPPKNNLAYECLGDKEFEGKTYAAYSAKLPGSEEASKDAKDAKPANLQTVYIDKATGLPVRNIVTKESDPGKRLFDGAFSVPEGLEIKAPDVKK